MIKITGLDRLAQQLEEAQRALSSLEGELGAVNFNPADPSSIEAAIQQMILLIDQRLGTTASNPLVASLAEQMKEQYRGAILKKAAAARLERE